MLPSSTRVYVPGCASVSASTSDDVVLLKELLNTTLSYGSISRQVAAAVPARAVTSKKKRSPAAAVKRYRSVSLPGLSAPLTGFPGTRGVAEARSLRRNE